MEDKAGTRSAGSSDGDAQQPYYFFSLLSSSFTLLLFSYSLKLNFLSLSSSLFFKVSLLDLHCPMFSLISLKFLALRLALSHVLS
jgi:hypothetical protein